MSPWDVPIPALAPRLAPATSTTRRRPPGRCGRHRPPRARLVGRVPRLLRSGGADAESTLGCNARGVASDMSRSPLRGTTDGPGAGKRTLRSSRPHRDGPATSHRSDGRDDDGEPHRRPGGDEARRDPLDICSDRHRAIPLPGGSQVRVDRVEAPPPADPGRRGARQGHQRARAVTLDAGRRRVRGSRVGQDHPARTVGRAICTADSRGWRSTSTTTTRSSCSPTWRPRWTASSRSTRRSSTRSRRAAPRWRPRWCRASVPRCHE